MNLVKGHLGKKICISQKAQKDKEDKIKRTTTKLPPMVTTSAAHISGTDPRQPSASYAANFLISTALGDCPWVALGLRVWSGRVVAMFI